MRILIALPFVMLAACGGGGGDDVSGGFDDQQIVVDFADQVVVPTYTTLDVRMNELADAVDALADNNDATHLEAARAAWVGAREPWEQNEAFLFGPVDSFGFDPALDSWPVNTTDLDAVLASQNEFTPEFIQGLDETQKGFHTMEYLLYAADLGDRELDYLSALADEATRITDQLALAWTDGLDGGAPYRDTIATAGEDGNTAFPSRLAAAQQILDGMIGICDEVANGKIADPYDAHDPNLVESQFSLNSLIDFSDNMISVRDAWRGESEVAGTSGRGLRDYVDERDPTLAARIDAEIQASLDALAAVPDLFPVAIVTPDDYDEIEAAQTAINTLQASLQGDVTTLVLQ